MSSFRADIGSVAASGAPLGAAPGPLLRALLLSLALPLMTAPLPAAAQSGSTLGDNILVAPLLPLAGDDAGQESTAGQSTTGQDTSTTGQDTTESSDTAAASAEGAPQSLLPESPTLGQTITGQTITGQGTAGQGTASQGATWTGFAGAAGSGSFGAGTTEIGSAPTQIQVDSAGKGDAQSAAGRYQPQGDAEGIGVLGPNEGGFGRRLWMGTDRRALEALLPRLPTNNSSPALYDLSRRLLLSDTVTPTPAAAKGLPPTDLLAVRLERLAALGEIEGLGALLEILPAEIQPELQRRLAIELLLTRGRDSEACQSVRAGAPEDGEDRFWLKALTYCQILGGDRAAAELGVTILRESARSEDRLFLRLAEAALGWQPLTPSDVTRMEPARIRPLEFALLTSLGLPLPPNLVLEAAPHARLQLIHNESANLADRTQAAEWAVATRRMPPGELALLYAAYGFSGEQIQSALTEGYGMQGVEARALYYQSMGKQDQPEQEIRAAELALERAEADEVYAATAMVVLPRLSVEPNDVTFAWFADTAGRALYVLGRYEEATAWLLLARQEAAISARAAVAAHRLWPYSRLAGVAAISNEAGLEGWRYAQPDPNGPKVAQQLSLLRVLFDALGETDAMAWIDLAMSDDERAQALPDASLLYALEDASYSGRLGETILLALIVMGETSPDEAHPLALNAVLSALMRVGLTLEARALAIEAALGNGI